MPPSTPDRALRRLVADLATARSQDIEAVLATLEPAPRARTEALLRELAGYDAEAGAHAPVHEAIEGLSPWLAARLSQELGLLALPRVGPDAFRLTETAQAALKAAAADLPRRPRPVTSPVAPTGWRTWLGGRRPGTRA